MILKSAINDEKALFFGGGGWPYWILPKGLTHDFEAKLKSLFFILPNGITHDFRAKLESLSCVFVEIKSKKTFHEVKECKNCRKDAFLTRSILGVAILDFSKGVNPSFR